jgi:hypothetical protein
LREIPNPAADLTASAPARSRSLPPSTRHRRLSDVVEWFHRDN